MAVSNESLNLLAKYVGGIQTAPSQVNTARQILLRSQIDWSAANFNPKSSSGGKSVVSRIFDVLSRPNYAVANVGVPILEDLARGDWKQAIRDADLFDPSNPEPTMRLMRGLAGKDKTTFTEEFLNNPELQDTNFGEWSKPARAGAGLVFDIALDPTTYIGGGLIGKGRFFNKGKNAIPPAGAVQDIPRIEQGTGQTSKVLEAVQNATSKIPEGKIAVPNVKAPGFGNITWGMKAEEGLIRSSEKARNKRIDEIAALERDPDAVEKILKRLSNVLSIPAHRRYGADFSSYMKAAKSAAKIGRQPGFYGQVQRATQLLNRIADNDPQAIHRVGPKLPSEVVKASHTEKSVAMITARSTVKKLKVPRDKFLNPKQQLVIFSQLLKQSKGGPIERMARSTAMMREAEKYLQSQGYGFKYWDGTGVRLTEIFDEMGSMSKVGPDLLRQLESNKIDFPPLDQAVEALRTRSAMKDSKFVELGLSQVTDAVAKAEGITTPARAEQAIKGFSQDLKLGMRGAQVSPAAQKTASTLFNVINNSRISTAQKAMNTTTTVAHDIMNSRATREVKISRENRISRAIEQHMNSKYRTVATSLGNNNKAIEFLGERFATHYGQSTMRPIAQDFLLSAQANAARRSQVWGNVIKTTSKEARRDALRAAQHLSRAGMMQPGDPALAYLFRDSIERLFSSTGVKDTAASVATRAAFTMDDINSELARIGSKFQFTNKKVEDFLGNAVDYSKNVDWLKSWENFKLPDNVDAIEFIHQLETAAEKVSKRYALLDEVAARFGSTRPIGVYRHLVEDPRLAGNYFTKEAAVQINQMNKMLKDVYQPTNNFIKQIDRVTSAWKSGVTIYAPSHHIRNLIGDTWMSWIAGVNSPKPYYLAAKVLKANKGRYSGSIPDVEKLVHPNAMIHTMERGGTPGVKATALVTRSRSGVPFTAEQIYIAAHQRGILLSARAIEDIYAEPLMPKVLGGKVQGFARGAAQSREHYVRLAHFIDSISKARGRNIKQIFDDAAHTVRKWHPDGMDLTNFERKYLRRIFPFYSWTRKAFPLVLESMVMKPGKVVMPAKFTEAIQGGLGMDTSRDDPFPSDQMFPDWMKEKGIGPIAATGGPLAGIAALSRQGESGGYTTVNPGNPMIDLISQFGGMGSPTEPLKGIASAVNPLARIPAEVATDKQMFTGVPVSYDPNRYATEQIPAGAIFSRLTNMGILGPTKRGEKEGLGNLEALINYGTAAGLTGSGPYKKQAEFEENMRKRKSGKRAIDQFLSQYGVSGR